MDKRIMHAAALLLSAALCIAGLLPGSLLKTLAAPADLPDPAQKGEVNIVLVYTDGDVKTPVDGAGFSLYQVAEIGENGEYVLTEAFAKAHADLSKLEEPGADVAIARTLALWADQQKISPSLGTKGTNQAGLATWRSISSDAFGLYLVMQAGSSGSAVDYDKVTPFLIPLPIFEEGGWNYIVTAYPKPVEKTTDPPDGGGNPPGGGGNTPLVPVPTPPTPERPAVPVPTPDTPITPGNPGGEGPSRTPSTGKTTVLEELLEEEIPLTTLGEMPVPLAKTGDESRMMVYLGTALAASGGLALWVVRRRKRQ